MATAASPHRTSTSAGTTDTPPPTHDSEGPLSDLRLGSRGRVIGLLEDEASGPIMRRLSNLGFVPGRIVTPLRRAPLGDPVVYLVADYELCLRHHEARIILVEAISDADTVTEAEAIAGPVASAEPTTEPAGEERNR